MFNNHKLNIEINNNPELETLLKNKLDAVQKPSTDEGVLGAKKPEVELQGMGKGNAQPEGPATGPGGTHSQGLRRLPLRGRQAQGGPHAQGPLRPGGAGADRRCRQDHHRGRCLPAPVHHRPHAADGAGLSPRHAQDPAHRAGTERSRPLHQEPMTVRGTGLAPYTPRTPAASPSQAGLRLDQER